MKTKTNQNVLSMRRWLLVAVVLFPALAYAETLYVIDRVVIGLRAEPIEGAAVVKSVDTGTALEVLERQENLVRVREPRGTEGWVDARYLVAQPPARVQTQELQAELARTRTQLAKAQAQLQQGEAPGAAAQKLETELASTRALLAQTQTQLKEAQAAQRVSPAPTPGSAPERGSFSVLWVVIGFAMLGLGFVAGIIWVRESIRRRMGGMYLRM